MTNIKPKVTGLAIVYDKHGRIKADNLENLSPEHQAILRKLIEEQENGGNPSNISPKRSVRRDR